MLLGRRGDRHLNLLLRIPFSVTVLTIPDLDIVNLILVELVQISRALGMNPASVWTLIFSRLTSNHEIRLDSTLTVAIKTGIKQTPILKWNNWGAKYGDLRWVRIMLLGDGEDLLSSFDILRDYVFVTRLNS